MVTGTCSRFRAPRIEHWLGFALAVLLLLLCSEQVYSDDRITSTVAPTTGSSDDTFLFAVRIPKDLGGGYPILTGGEGFSITLRGPRDVDAGAATVYEYQLIPRGVGTLETPGVQVDMRDGSRVELRPISVTVIQGRQERRGAGVSDIMLQQSVSKSTLFLGEQLSAPIELLAAIPIFDVSLPVETPPGFISEPLNQEERERRFIDGREFSVVRYFRTLFPTSTGEIQVPAATLSAKMRVLRSHSSPFLGGMMRTYSFEEVTVRSNELRLTILPLPPPAQGTNLPIGGVPVGQSTIRLRGAFREGMVGVARQLIVEISSEGNLRPLDARMYPEISGARLYVDGDQIVPMHHQGRVTFRRTVQYSLVPTVAGTITVPPIELNWFDPSRREYRTARVEGFTASISPNPRASPPPTSSVPADVLNTATAAQPAGAAEPAWRFEELSFFMQIYEELGPARVIFYLAALFGSLGVAFALTIAVRHTRRSMAVVQQIERASSLEEYRSVLQDLVGVVSLSPDSLRYAVGQITADPAERLLFYELIDDLYSPLSLTREQQARVRRNLSTLVEMRCSTPRADLPLSRREGS